MPSLTTANAEVFGVLAARRIRLLGQLLSASTVDPSPSVIESPNATTNRSDGSAGTRTAPSEIDAVDLAAAAIFSA